MSILIKGMEMPKSNTMFTVTLRVRQDGTAEFISTSGKTVKSFPMVEVPTPHGDLIDSDDVIDEINRVTFVSQYDYNTAYNIVEQADAVIEAEVSAE